MIIFAQPLSIASFLIQMALDELELDIELTWVAPGDEPEAFVSRGRPRLPCVVADSGPPISDPIVIARLLGRLHPERSWETPTAGVERAKDDWIAHFATDEIGPAAAAIFHGACVAPISGAEPPTERIEEAWQWIAGKQPRLGGISRMDILARRIGEGWLQAAPLRLSAIAIAAAFMPLLLAEKSLEPWPAVRDVVGALARRDSVGWQLEDVRELLA